MSFGDDIAGINKIVKWLKTAGWVTKVFLLVKQQRTVLTLMPNKCKSTLRGLFTRFSG